jgi:hypothetical protein
MPVSHVGFCFSLCDRNRAGLSFDTENLYTFHFWQHLLDLSAYELDMGVAQFDISSHLNGQPLQLMVKQQSTGTLLTFVVRPFRCSVEGEACTPACADYDRGR